MLDNPKLTARQQQILDLIQTAIARTGAPPTRAEIAAMLHRFVEKYGLKPVVTPTGTTGWTKPTISGNSITSPKTGESSQFLWQDYLLM